MTSPSALTGLDQTPAAGTQLATTNSASDLANSFITLLVAQLQAQDPLNPMDPTQMVSELTEINSLQQLVQIRTDLDQVTGSQTGTTTGSTNSSTSQTGSTTGS